MKIKFLALLDTFDYDQIGGTDSYMRRLSKFLIIENYEVEWNFYGSDYHHNEERNGIKINFFRSFKEALDYCIKDPESKLVACYLKPFDKLKLFKLRWNPNLELRLLTFFFPNNIFTKIFRILEIKLLKVNGVYCVSRRLEEFYRKMKCKSIFLPPIIPEEYFEIGYAKAKKRILNDTEKIRALFLGRLDPRKGISDLISLINLSQLKDKIIWTVSGILIEKDFGNLEAYEALSNIDSVNFIKENRNEYSNDTESRVLSLFEKSDYFLQPYKSLSSTVDLPLLLLEAQASGCIVITSLPNILNEYLYGKSCAISNDFVNVSSKLLLEKPGIDYDSHQQIEDLDKLKSLYCADSVIKNFRNLIDE